jgi:hypothetical protein
VTEGEADSVFLTHALSLPQETEFNLQAHAVSNAATSRDRVQSR